MTTDLIILALSPVLTIIGIIVVAIIVITIGKWMRAGKRRTKSTEATPTPLRRNSDRR